MLLNLQRIPLAKASESIPQIQTAVVKAALKEVVYERYGRYKKA
jgi:hypothetical protein